MTAESRESREAKVIEAVIEAVREYLPDLFVPGAVIQITRLDPAQNDGAMFSVARTPAFVCPAGRRSLMAAKLNYSAVVAKAKEMQAAQRRWCHERGEEPGASWCALPDWMKLSWFCEAAAELGMDL